MDSSDSFFQESSSTRVRSCSDGATAAASTSRAASGHRGHDPDRQETRTVPPLRDRRVAGTGATAFETTGTVTADARLGPLYAYVDGLGLTVTLVPNQRERRARQIRPRLRAQAADRLRGRARRAEPIAGGGFLAVCDNEYRGALALKFETFGFAAFAILNTTLPGGQPASRLSRRSSATSSSRSATAFSSPGSAA